MSEFTFYPGTKLPPKPLVNFSGAACWWNSLLQFMVSITQIYDILKVSDNNELAVAYVEFVEGRRDHVSLFKTFTDVAKDLDQGQQCSREGFERFIDELKNIQINKLLTVGIRKYVKCNDCGQNNGIDVHDPTTRTNNTVVGYYYNHNIRTPDDFVQFIRRHDYQLEWKCENTACSLYQKTQKISAYDQLTRVNSVMCFHMNKYGIKPLQYFPDKFEIPVKDSALKYKFHLIATTEHSGGPTGGHYQARGVRCVTDAENTKLAVYWFNDSAAPVPCDLKPRITTVMLAYVMTGIE